MQPYGIILKEDKFELQESYLIWQKKFGILKISTFIKSVVLPVSVFSVLLFILTIISDKMKNDVNIEASLAVTAVYGLFFMYYVYGTAKRTVKGFTGNPKGRRVQVVLKEDTMEILTEYSKEIIYYEEIELCYEKNFILTVIYDKGTFPLTISKMSVEKGDYNTFISMLEHRIPEKYQKKGVI